MAKVMGLSITSKVGNEIVRMQRVRLIRTSRAHLKIGCDLLDAKTAREIAALVHLVLDAVGPVFGHTLLDGIGVCERPSSIKVCLSDRFTSIAAAAFWLDSSVTGTTKIGIARVADLLQIIFHVC